MQNKNCKSELYWRDSIFFCSLTVLVFVCLYLAKFGFCSFDEAFYLTIPQRIWSGSKLLFDEWHGSQFSALLLYPVYSAYFALGGTMDGIILNFRYIYLVFQVVLAVFVYIRLRKQYQWSSVVAALLLFSYSPFNIRALSYNTMGIGFFALGAVILATTKNRRYLDCILAGFCYGCSVLCCPYLILVFVVYFGYRCFGIVHKKRGRSVLFSWKELGFFCIGAGTVAVYLLVFLLVQGGFSGCIHMLPYILDDPEHSGISFGQKALSYGYSIFVMNIGSILAVCTSCVFLLLRVFHKPIDKRIKFITGCVVTVVWLIISVVQSKQWNYIVMPISYLALVAYINTVQKNKKTFWLAFVPALGYTFCINLSSNLEIMAIASVSCITTVIGLLFIEEFVKELGSENCEQRRWNPVRVCEGALCMVIILQLLSMYAMKTVDYPLDMQEYKSNQTAEIDFGICDGLVTTQSNATLYKRTMEDTKQLRATNEKVLYYTPKCWLYLADGKPYSSYSAWMSINCFDDINEKICERLKTYWSLHSKNKPHYIWIDNSVRQEPYSVLNWLEIEEFLVEEKQTGFLVTVLDECESSFQ